MDEANPATGGRQKRVKREEVRRRILQTALREFTVRGYEAASMEQVAEAAGFSKGAAYSNFATKDELFFELIAARIDERAEAIQQKADRRVREMSGALSPGLLADLIGQELQDLGAAEPEWQVLFIEFWLRCIRNPGLKRQLTEKRRRMRQAMADFIVGQAVTANLAIPAAAALQLATTILALSNGLGIEGMMDDAAVSPGQFGEVLSAVIQDQFDRG